MKYKLLFCLTCYFVIVLFITSRGDAVEVESNTSKFGFTTINGSLYYINPTYVNFYTAMRFCYSKDMKLISFQTAEKRIMISQYLNDPEYYDYSFWTSGIRAYKREFIWSATGQPFEHTFWGTLWSLEQPDESASTVDVCVYLSKDLNNEFRSWYDTDCAQEVGILCEEMDKYY